jgi:hypothetical protein
MEPRSTERILNLPVRGGRLSGGVFGGRSSFVEIMLFAGFIRRS